MDPSEQNIENALHRAPKPAPRAGLKDRLAAQARLPSLSSGTSAASYEPASWLRQWWPALAPAAISLGCAAVLFAQDSQIRDLKRTIQARSPAVQSSPPAEASIPLSNRGVSIVTEAEEISRLKEMVARLSAEVAQLEQVQSENQKLRLKLAEPIPGALSPDEADAVAQARANAERMMCINNLKQLGLAARMWALDHQDMTPPIVLCMSNEMATPKILACPTDTAHPAAPDWSSWTSANSSYEYLAPSTPDNEQPNRVIFRCPIHGNVTLFDGSVQSGVAKTHPEQFIQREGKTFLEREPAPAQ